MTCKQMGGTCDHPITASSSEEMMSEGMKHIEASHPEMAADIKAMPKDDPKMKAWYEKFMKDYSSMPDTI